MVITVPELFSPERGNIVGVNYKRSRHNELNVFEKKQKQFDRELRECMNCRYFWGNNHRCVTSNCGKQKSKIVADTKIPKKCVGCPYRQSEGYCFPCMKDILDRKES